MKKIILQLLCTLLIAFGTTATVMAQDYTLPTGGVRPVSSHTLKEIPDPEAIEFYEPKESDDLGLFEAAPDWVTHRNNQLYNYIGKQENGKDRQAAYNEIFNSFVAFTTDRNAGLSYDSYNKMYAFYLDLREYESLLTWDSSVIAEVAYAVLQDNPQFFYIKGIYTINGENILIPQVDDYYKDVNERILEMELITEGIEGYDAIVSKNMSNYAIEKKVHDKLVKDNTYLYENNKPSDSIYAHNIAGSLSSRYTGGVCESYAKAFKLLLNRYEVPCYYVAGDAGGGHAWNHVQLDNGKFYCVDVTWDDATTAANQSILSYKYFNMPSSRFYSERKIDEAYLYLAEAVPACEDDSSYYTKAPDKWEYDPYLDMYIFQAPDVSEEGTRVVPTTEAVTEATTAVKREYTTEATTCALQVLAKDSPMPLFITKGSGTNVSGINVTNLGSFTTAQKAGAGEIISFIAPNGFELSYYQMGPSGEYEIWVDDRLWETVTNNSEVTCWQSELTVREAGMHKVTFKVKSGTISVFDLKADDIYDLNGDGCVDLKDAIAIYSADIDYVYDFFEYDLNGDNLVGSADVALILRYIAGLK